MRKARAFTEGELGVKDISLLFESPGSVSASWASQEHQKSKQAQLEDVKT